METKLKTSLEKGFPRSEIITDYPLLSHSAFTDSFVLVAYLTHLEFILV